MKRSLTLFSLFLFLCFSARGQSFSLGMQASAFKKDPLFKVKQRGFGAVLGVQRGKYTFIELGAEYYWRKIKLIKPQTFTVGGNFGYNIGNNILGYRMYAYYREGRFNLTYGGGISYYTDFTNHRPGITPQLGYRLFNLHVYTGVNLLGGNTDFKTYNTLFVAANYYFPVKRKLKMETKKKKDN